jgi:hypothetical protein
MRQAARLDGNHSEIVRALLSSGCTVQSLAALGDGVPDLLVGVAGRNLLLEVKDPAQPPSKRRLTPDQKEWHDLWRGTAHVVETVDQALAIVAFARGVIVRPPP